jgi:hypothetical protein
MLVYYPANYIIMRRFSTSIGLQAAIFHHRHYQSWLKIWLIGKSHSRFIGSQLIFDRSRCQTADNLLVALDNRINSLQNQAQIEAERAVEYNEKRNTVFFEYHNGGVADNPIFTGKTKGMVGEGGEDILATGMGSHGGRMWVRIPSFSHMGDADDRLG